VGGGRRDRKEVGAGRKESVHRAGGGTVIRIWEGPGCGGRGVRGVKWGGNVGRGGHGGGKGV